MKRGPAASDLAAGRPQGTSLHVVVSLPPPLLEVAEDVREVLRELLGIPEEVTPVGVIPIGHRAPDVPSPSLKGGCKPGSEYIHHEKW